MTETILIRDLEFEVRRSARRKSTEITVDRNGALVISAPEHQAADVLKTFVRERLTWIYAKLAEKDSRQHFAAKKEFVTGEGFWYLGRSYRLQIVPDQSEPLVLQHGRFRLREDRIGSAHADFRAWYTAHALPWIKSRVDLVAPRIAVYPSQIDIRDLKNRWASCGKGQVLHFHWAAILLPPRIVEYLIIHEMVHLLEPHHTPAFWNRVARVDPDFNNHKRWLAGHGSKYLAMTNAER